MSVGPRRIIDLTSAGGLPGETPEQWFVRIFGKPPPPTADMDIPQDTSFEDRRREAMVSLERTIPPAFQWARFAAPQLALRVLPRSAASEGQAASESARMCLIGAARAGKTSLAVAMLRRRVSKTGMTAIFFPAQRLGMARIQHPAGHGEPDIVDQAIHIPLALIDDLGHERDMSMNAIPDIVSERHAANRATWITTGMTREQLVTRYGQGTVARLFEGAKVIRLG
jgi:hypothetical protein